MAEVVSPAHQFDLVLLGGGTGGYVAAIRAKQLGLNVAVVEEIKLGGTCLHRGCIPTKAFLKSADVFDQVKKAAEFGVNVAGDVSFSYDTALQRSLKIVDGQYRGLLYLFDKKHKIPVFMGRGTLLSATTVGVTPNDGSAPFALQAKNVIINTGSRPRPIKGVPYDGVRVINSDHAVVLDHLPQSFLIRGGGATGVEWASVYHRYGSKVTLVGNIVPQEDAEVQDALTRAFQRQKMDLAPGARPEGCRFNDRCPHAVDRCRQVVPELYEVSPGHQARCVRVGEIGRWDISRGTVPDSDPNAPRDIILSIEDLSVFYGRKQVVFDVSFDLARSEVVALVGESGSGKTTISRCVGGLHKEWTGKVDFDGTALARGARARSAAERKRIQYIFQNPYLSLNPRLTIEQIVKRPMELFGIASGTEATDRVVALLDQVALGPAVLHYQASRLSGGERQRVAIARALAAEPDVLVCDEVTSALDVSVQGSIVELLEDLRKTRGISMLFVTHNLALVRSIAARVQILNGGRVVESGSVVEVMDSPREEYTKKLLANSPRID
jgi:ABC-type dipeptide/oligopeptide/nickel transport system ATPase subunit/thioredoxin reductase